MNPKKINDGCCLKLLELKANPLWSIRFIELTMLVIFLGEFCLAKYSANKKVHTSNIINDIKILISKMFFFVFSIMLILSSIKIY